MYHFGKILSSCIFSKMLRKGSAEYITSVIVHSENFEGLADYVRHVMSESRLSYRDIEETAATKGHHISNGYVSKIVSGAAQNISVDKLRALAAGLNRPEEEVFAVARGGRTEEKIKDALASAMLYKYQQLEESDKEKLATLLRALEW